VNNIALPAAFSDDPVDASGETPIDLVDANGIIVTLSGIPAEADIGFGTPPILYRVGRVTFGTDTAWFPSFELEHNPLVIAPLPPGVTRVVVSTRPPVAATVVILRPGK
jgi:hypothetical protein